MAILIRPPRNRKKMLRKKASVGNSKEILERLDAYLRDNTDEPIEILCGFWKDQSKAITYQELRQAVLDGSLTEETYREWSKDYSLFVQNRLHTMWESAVAAGAISQPLIYNLSAFTFNASAPAVMSFVQMRAANLVTNSAQEQKEAIRALLEQSIRERHSVDELAKMIRPCIGLTVPQAKANLRYYESVIATLKENNPKMRQSTIEKKAREAAAKYAEKQHRSRAMTIARTEMATAYNKGADESVRQAQEQKLIGKVIKRWCTARDDQVCPQCQALDGTEIAMDDGFDIKGGAGENLTPPAHPNCACGIEYVEVGSADA